MNTRLDCAAYSERAMDMQAKTQCLGLLYQMDFAAHFLELLQPQLQSTSESATIAEEHKLLENCTPLITIVIVVYLSCLDRSDISFSLVRESNAILTVFYSMAVELLEML
jgi:hypothetical protein